ncbi:MAG: retropepsin-like aspartic protease [Acetobacteraceae bacterium]
MLRLVRAAGVGALLALGACQSTTNTLFGVGDCTLERLGETPIQTHDRLIFVTVQLDGHPANLVVDTGADRTVLSPDAVKHLGLPPDFGHGTRTWGVGGPTAHFDARVNSFEFAGMALPLHRIAVGDLSIAPLGGSVDGVLGTDVLHWFDVDLDTPHGQMTLYRGEPCWLKAPPWDEPWVAVAGVQGLRSGTQTPRTLLMPIEVDGIRTLALLDTGSQTSAVMQPLARQAGVTIAMLRADPVVIIGGAGPAAVPVPMHRFHTLQIASWMANDPVLPVLDLPEGVEAHAFQAQPLWHGLVGEDFLFGHRIWMSFAGWQIFISRPASTPTHS